ncbi:hypothetical protein PG996_000456 [Apiospora saccharicola]|uniref:Uncharacterized protein n=1 Tax=Apiospora saccharicola TaxID=335842 RepID=A0ABR1WDW4_9PEZI
MISPTPSSVDFVKFMIWLLRILLSAIAHLSTKYPTEQVTAIKWGAATRSNQSALAINLPKELPSATTPPSPPASTPWRPRSRRRQTPSAVQSRWRGGTSIAAKKRRRRRLMVPLSLPAPTGSKAKAYHLHLRQRVVHREHCRHYQATTIPPSPSISTAGSSQDQEGQPQQPKSPSSSSSSQDDTSGTATTIGISAGVSVAVVLLIIGAVLLVVRRRRRGRGRGRRSSSFSAGDEREEYLATGPAPAHLLYPTGMEQLQPQPQQQQQQQQDHPQWWTEEEMPAHLAPATTKIRPCELTDGSPYQRAVAEMGGGWQR